MHDRKIQTRFHRLVRAAQSIVQRGKTAKDSLVSDELIRDRRRECAQESLEDILKGVTPDKVHPLIDPGPDIGKDVISDN